MVNERLTKALSFADAKKSGAAILWEEKGKIGSCSQCKKPIDDITDVGYMGPEDRGSQECSPMMSFDLVCAECEGKSVLA